MSSRRTILIAIGNAGDAERFNEHFRNAEYDIHFVTDGTAVIDCVEQLEPQLIVLAPMMAGINGFEFCKRIKDRQANRTMIMMVSNQNELCDVERAVAAGVDDFLSQPVNKIELCKRVDNLLKLHDCTN